MASAPSEPAPEPATAPPIMPVSLAEAKAFLRIEHGEEDALLAGMMRSATAMCEAFTRLALIERTIAETIAASGCWTRLGATPVRSIEAVAAVGAAGGESALAPGAHAVDIDAAGDGWVRLIGGREARVRVRYRAGLASDWNGVPEPLRQGIVRLAAHLFVERDGDGGPPAAVAALWRPWRRMRIT